MNRRRFIQLVTSSAIAAYAFDPERLLWVPGEKKIFIPPPRRLIYSAEIPENEITGWGFAVRELEEYTKYFYEIIEKPYIGPSRMRYIHVELYEGIKGLNHE